MTSAWFRYEPDHACRWIPVVYYSATPKKVDGSTDLRPVPDDCLSPDGSPMFGLLKTRFPAPKGDQR